MHVALRIERTLQIARSVTGLIVTGHYPLDHHLARLAFEHQEQYCFS